ncbi:hypothetical protein BV22DRAFT_1134019 [Leucogyrophana mollusca]|uniref:Uncharacterized protein n=1 Tax=Leucogyrophana mollusca TaxID=85980 RepID=A0ACB8B0K1_9AGAM|nr:hypothetical protein BV22DRAFT_1134019 [Leucogyrophana mollusca]
MSDQIIDSANVTVRGDTVVLDIDGIHESWPTYVINFTPKQPGPIKLVLRFTKDAPLKHPESDEGDPDTTLIESPVKSSKHEMDNTLVTAEPIILHGIRTDPVLSEEAIDDDEDDEDDEDNVDDDVNNDHDDD